MFEIFSCVERCTSCPTWRQYIITAMSDAITALIFASFAASMISCICGMSSPYMMVLTVRYDFMPCSSHRAAISRRSSMVNADAEWARIFSFPMPKYMLSAPALTAAAKDSLDPTGAIISRFPILLRQECP